MANPLGLLGLARRGGRIVLGEAAVEAHLRQGNQVKLLLLASDAAANAVRRAEHWSATYRIELIKISQSKQEFGNAMGRNVCALAALTDDGLAAAYKKSLLDI